MAELTPEEFLDTVLVPEKSSDHICWNCRGLKPVLKGSKFPPADIIGWCMKIHWPHYWCIADFNVVKKCYAFEERKKGSVEENVRKELEGLKQMMQNWKRGFLSWASPDGDNDYVLLEFTEEIQQQIYPYVNRLREAEHLNDAEAREFMDYCYSQVDDLRDQLREVETDESE